MSKRPYRTAHQRELMGLILREAGNGRFLSPTELHAMISYGASYGAVRKTLYTLIDRGMLVRRQNGRTALMIPTERGYDWFRPLRS